FIGVHRLGACDRRPEEGAPRGTTVLADLASDRRDERLCCTLDPARTLFGADNPMPYDPGRVWRRYAPESTELAFIRSRRAGSIVIPGTGRSQPSPRHN